MMAFAKDEPTRLYFQPLHNQVFTADLSPLILNHLTSLDDLANFERSCQTFKRALRRHFSSLKHVQLVEHLFPRSVSAAQCCIAGYSVERVQNLGGALRWLLLRAGNVDSVALCTSPLLPKEDLDLPAAPFLLSLLSDVFLAVCEEDSRLLALSLSGRFSALRFEPRAPVRMPRLRSLSWRNAIATPRRLFLPVEAPQLECLELVGAHFLFVDCCRTIDERFIVLKVVDVVERDDDPYFSMGKCDNLREIRLEGCVVNSVHLRDSAENPKRALAVTFAQFSQLERLQLVESFAHNRQKDIYNNLFTLARPSFGQLKHLELNFAPCVGGLQCLEKWPYKLPNLQFLRLRRVDFERLVDFVSAFLRQRRRKPVHLEMQAALSGARPEGSLAQLEARLKHELTSCTVEMHPEDPEKLIAKLGLKSIEILLISC